MALSKLPEKSRALSNVSSFGVIDLTILKAVSHNLLTFISSNPDEKSKSPNVHDDVPGKKHVPDTST